MNKLFQALTVIMAGIRQVAVKFASAVEKPVFAIVRKLVMPVVDSVSAFARTVNPRLAQFGAALAVALSIAHLEGVFSPAHAASFSIDLAGVLDIAASLFNGLFPIFGIILGITIGIGLITMVIGRVSKVFGHG